jgi:hypothetical protein
MRLKITAPDGQSISEEVKLGDFHAIRRAGSAMSF